MFQLTEAERTNCNCNTLHTLHPMENDQRNDVSLSRRRWQIYVSMGHGGSSWFIVKIQIVLYFLHFFVAYSTLHNPVRRSVRQLVRQSVQWSLCLSIDRLVRQFVCPSQSFGYIAMLLPRLWAVHHCASPNRPFLSQPLPTHARLDWPSISGFVYLLNEIKWAHNAT